MKMFQFYAVIILSFIITTSSVTFTEATRLVHNNGKHNSAVVVVGSVYCDTSSSQVTSSKPIPTYYISGALVGVECAGINKEATQFTKQVKTNEHGEFQVQLPAFSSLNKIKKRCFVKLIKSNDPNCDVASTPTTTSFHIKPNKDQKHTILSAGHISFKPSKHPQLCNKKISKQQFGFFPPIPFLPPPSILPPNPLIPPPSIFPPIIPSPPTSIFPPLVPSPPPSIFPPILPSPPSPPPSLFPPIGFPPVPGFTPASPPPPPPSPKFPVPLPPFPFPPVPGFPGVPPAATSSVSP